MNDIHDMACASASMIVARQQLRIGKAFGEIEQDCRDLGQWATVDQ